MATRLTTLIRIFLIASMVFSFTQSAASYNGPAPVSQNTITGLFRTRVVLPDANALPRLNKLGVRILETGKSDALVLATSDQLASLAKLRFEPASTDDLGSLVGANAVTSPWLEQSLRPELVQAASLSSQIEQAQNQAATLQTANASPEVQTANSSLQGILTGLTPEQANALTTLSAVDDDADGLTNTQEQWWCTDPLNPYTREDPNKTGTGIHKDGNYVSRLLQYLYHPEQGDNRLGAPFAGWPMVPGDGHFNANCLDADKDGVPDLAEMYVIGSNPNAESTVHDRYDDGQKLFNLTPPNWGVLPRAADGAYASLNLPGYVQWPGRSLFAAAIAQPKVAVVDSSLHVATVTTITTDHTITSGTEKSYSTANMEGTSTSRSDTVNWSNWQEASQSKTEHLLSSSSKTTASLNYNSIQNSTAGTNTNYQKETGNLDTQAQILTMQPPKDCLDYERNASVGGGINASIGVDAGIQANIGDDISVTRGASVTVNSAWADEKCKYYMKSIGLLQDDQKPNSFDPGILLKGFEGLQYTFQQTGQLQANRLYEIGQILAAPTTTTTNTNGQSWGGAYTNTSSQYEEQTVTNGQAFSNSDAWGTATAVDSAHAADLWFSYTVSNAGTDFAGTISNLTFNVYIGSDPNPVYTYYAAPEIGGDGALHNFMPGETHTYTSHHIPLNLDQMKAIDLGQPLRIVLEDYSYGADEQFYEDAATSDLQIAIDDGPADGDLTLDNYILPTWGGSETVLDVLARYFPHTVDENNALTAIWTPEYRSDIPAWCVEPRVVTAGGQHSLWCKHALSTADWWNIYTSGMGDGSQGLQDTIALPNSVALFRFNQDSDLDGYSDATEIQLGTDPHDAASFPHPELLAGVNNIPRTDSNVVSTLSLLNTGLYDAYGVEAVMIAPDDSITITNNTVGGSGRVKALKQVVVGSSIQAPLYTAGSWTGTAKPAAGGYYTGTVNHTYTFTVNCSLPGGCDVGKDAWTLGWTDDGGGSGSIDFAGYASPNLLPVGSLGVKVSLLTGNVYTGNTFTVAANTPSDTFQYTINRTPYTSPVVVVSYNDPQGNHRFIIPPAAMSLANPTDNLAAFSGKMLQDPSVQLVTTAPFAAGANTTNLVVNNPSGVTLTGSKLFLEFIDPSGAVASEISTTQTLPAGPSVAPVSWNTSAFSPAYDPAQDYIVMVFWTDLQGNIIATSGRPLSSFQADPKPAFAMVDTDAAWDFGNAKQGTLLKRSFTFANTGQMELLTYVSAPSGMSVSQTGSRSMGPADSTTYDISLNTSNQLLGAYDQTVTIHTSDPANPTRTVHVSGTIMVGTADNPAGAVQRPLDYTVTIPGSHSQGEWYEFTQSLGPDPASLQPVKVYSQDYSKLWGIGKYATQFGSGTASGELFADGQDGDLLVTAGQTIFADNTRSAVASSASAGQNQITLTNSSSFAAGQEVIIIQMQGTGSGSTEFRRISSVSGNTLTLNKNLTNSYTVGGNSKAQVIRVMNYFNLTIQTGGTLTVNAWDGATGGVLAIRISGTAQIDGQIIGDGLGLRGGYRGEFGASAQSQGWQGESYPGTGSPTFDANGGGGGGGVGDHGNQGCPTDGKCVGQGAGGGGYGTAGQNGTSSGSVLYQFGYGGASYGGPDLSTAIFPGSGGGGGGSDNGTSSPGGFGGAGGGIIILTANNLNVNGSVTANGQAGWTALGGSGRTGGGGGGSGGSIFLIGGHTNLSANKVIASGGSGDPGHSTNGDPYGGNGGAGGSGRIWVQYCDSITGSTNPSVNPVKINCYIAEQVESAPYTTSRLNLPQSFDNGQTYPIQFGRMLTFSASGEKTSILRLTVGLLASSTMDALISNLGTGTLNFSVDIGNHGSWDWTSTSAVSDSAALNSPDLSAAFNAYWTSHGAPSTGTIDVPIRVSMDQPGQLLLTNLQVTPGGSKLRTLRLPANTYGSVLLNYTLSGGSGPVSVAVDVGNNGSIDNTWSGSPSSYPTTHNTGNLAAAINAYLAGKTGDVDIPIRFYVAPDHTLAFNSFSTAFAVQPDAALTAPDIHLPTTPPVEGDIVAVSATLHNLTAQATGGLTASFFATAPGWGDWYIGSAFVPDIPASGSAVAAINWSTLGFTGATPIKVIIDPYNRLAEANEANNTAQASLTINTRADLQVSGLTLSNPQPVTGEAVTVTVSDQNTGQTNAPASTLSLYDGNPASGGVWIGDTTPAVPGLGSSDQPFTWTPSSPGPHRLFAVSDRFGVINESDKSNNTTWQDVYVGFAGPLLLDSGNLASDPAYSAASGFGVVDIGQPDVLTTCGSGTLTENTLRLDPNGKLRYRFDHLLPGHFYHLDIVLNECDGAGRQENVTVNNTQIAGPEDLGDAKVHRLSLRLDPALYANHGIQVDITAPGTDGAVVSAVNLYDVDYRYADSGSSTEPKYSALAGFGWLDGAAITSNGTLPYQSSRVNQTGNIVQYQFDHLNPIKRYNIHFTFWQPSGTTHLETAQIDGANTSLTVDTGDYQVHQITIPIPQTAYAADGSIVVGILRTNATTGAMVNEIAIEEETLPVVFYCDVHPTPLFSETYGSLTFFGQPAPVGTVVQAVDPRGDVVGCFVVSTAGQYGLMRIYGEDTSTQPATPGMRAGEMVTFYANGIGAFATPTFIWQNDQSSHIVNLDVQAMVSQSILLNPGWNLISFNEESPAPLINTMISSISSRVGRIIGETGFFSPTLPDPFVTLKELHSGRSYYIYINGSTTVSWQVNGAAVASSTPIPLHTGWNWISAPPTSYPVTTALAGISGHFKRVINLTLTYDPSLADTFNTLKNMTPPEGYLLYAKDAISLVYPSGSAMAQQNLNPVKAARSTGQGCPSANNTPTFTFAYGDVSLNGAPAPLGSTITALSPRGDLVGCATVTTAGKYGAMYLYGEDTTVNPAISGMRPDEAIRFYINGVLASSNLSWSDDKDIHAIDLTAQQTTTVPSADFNAANLNGVVPFEVQFNDTSTGKITSWSWNFGDGGTSNGQNPKHSYQSPGAYTVSLTVSGPDGMNIKTNYDYITVNGRNIYLPVVIK